jgi:hypothetical protein
MEYTAEFTKLFWQLVLASFLVSEISGYQIIHLEFADVHAVATTTHVKEESWMHVISLDFRKLLV